MGEGKADDAYQVIDTEELLESVKQAAVDEERVDFIRQAAIAYLAALPWSATETTDPSLYAEAWQEAKALWSAKPEDC
jgi:hypothetical protein